MADLLNNQFCLVIQQHKLLMQCLTDALKQERVEVRPHSLSCALVAVHRILHSTRPRLQAVLDMAACHPQAIQMLLDKILDPGTISPDAEPELVEDILLLEILTEELTPEKNQLNTDEGCRTWLNNYNTVASAVSRVLDEAETHITSDQWLGETRELITVEKTWFAYGQWCREHITKIKYQWTRVSAVKLFIDFMTPLVTEANSMRVEAINYNLLWTLLGSEANLKTLKTLKSVDKYLKLANTKMVKAIMGDVGICSHCKTKLEGSPIELPCGHRICDKCFHQEVNINHLCPECREAVPPQYQPQFAGCSDGKAVERLVLYQNQTSAFLMAVVSQLCFGGPQPPEPDVVEHIFSYLIKRVEGVATIQTQKLTLRDDQMDPTPVLRSFILRLLLKHSELVVSGHIDAFLSSAKTLIEQQVELDRIVQPSSVHTELSLLIIHCIENLEYEKDASKAEDLQPEESFAARCRLIKDELSKIRLQLDDSSLEFSTLIALGQMRHALCVFASLLYEHFVQPANVQGIHREMKNLLLEASVICTKMSTEWPKNFLVKQLCREYGIQSYMAIVCHAEKEKSLQYIKLDNLEEKIEVPDRYLVCGPEYRTVRDDLMQELRGEQGDLTAWQGMACSDAKKQYLILMSLHREALMSFLTSPESTQVKLKEKAVSLLQSRRIHVDKVFAKRIIDNVLGVDESAMHSSEEQSLGDHNLVCLLCHLWFALRAQHHERDLLTFLAKLIEQPAQLMNSYLPTMPQDDILEIMQAMNIDNSRTLQDYTNGRKETAKLWQCRNGHRYAIGDCGNPNGSAACPACGEVVGAAAYHVAAEGNVIADTIDRTKPGHTLGSPGSRSTEPLPERTMSATVCSIVKFLLHAVLYISASQPQQAATLSHMVQPSIRELDVLDFFWGHMQKDMEALQNVLGRSCDDIYLILHHLCHQFVELPSVPCRLTLLNSKSERQKWEMEFVETYIIPVLQTADDVVQTGNKLLLSDTRQGQNQLLNLAFEVGDADIGDGGELQHTAAPWKYRTRITVDHFFRQFVQQVHSGHLTKDQLPVLKLFHEESHHLRALYYLPDILALQRRLLQQLRHRLNRTEAAKMSVRDLLDQGENPELKQLLRIFSKAWDLVKTYLISYRCTTPEGKLLQLSADYQAVSVSETSPIGLLLPDTEDPGRCAYLLIHYLLVRHNDFLQQYCPHTRNSYDTLPKVDVNMVTQRHLVSCNPQRDLMPLVLAHCNYSLHLGDSRDGSSATTLEYDFQGFELQLKNTLLLGKSRVHRNSNGSFEIETITFCADTTNAKLIKSLREKIAQESIELHVQRQIASDFHGSLPDICKSIDSLNTTLTFLLTLNISADQTLHYFMTETLKMGDSGLHSRKAEQYCYMRHFQSLWLLLCFSRARILAIQKQEAFDGQGMELRHELDVIQRRELDGWLRRLSPDRVELVLTQLYQCIMLQLMGHSDEEDQAKPDNYSIHWLLTNSFENPTYMTNDSVQENLTMEDLTAFPLSITASKAIPTWLHLACHLETRHQHIACSLQ